MSDNPESLPPGLPELPASPSPRAFVTGTGFVFQIIGGVYCAAGGLYWLAGGAAQPITDVPVGQFSDYFDPANMLLTVAAINSLGGIVGGMALLAVGIGLQGERRGSGVAAMIATGILAAISWAGAVLNIVYGPAWIRVILTAMYATTNTAFFLLAGHCAGILKKHPPPKNQNVVDDAWLEAHSRSRHSR